MKIQLTENTGNALRDSLVVLYRGKLERLMDERSRCQRSYDLTEVMSKIRLLNFLIAELQAIEII